MKKKFTIVLLVLLFTASLFTATITVGTGTSIDRYPLGDYYVYQRSQMLFTSSEIGVSGDITHLRWYRNDTGASTGGDVEIWLKETTDTSVSGTTWETPGTLVYSTTSLDLGSGDAWVEIDITDFAYGGTDNLLVSTYIQNAPYTSPHTYWRYTTTSPTYMMRRGQSDTSNPPSLSTSYYRPNIQFEITPTLPFLSALPTSLDFGYVPSGSTSELNYALSGVNLTSGPIVVTAPTGFQVSLTSGSGFASTINVTYTAPTLAATTIYVEFAPTGVPADYSGNVTNVGGSTNVDVAVSGSSILSYCTPAPTSVDGQGITNVTFSTVNNTTGDETGHYGDYSAMIGDVAQSLTIPLDITYSTGYTYVTEVWIDWNIDGDFDDAGENVYSGVSTSSNPTTLSASFDVPLTASLGHHRLRIGGTDTGPPTPCYTGSYGSYEDYTVNVTSAPSILAPTALNASNIGITSADLDWTENNTPPATLWDIEWGAAGFTLGSGTPINNTSTKAYPLSGLALNTTYDFYVRSDDGTKATSNWSTKGTFTTSDGVAVNPTPANGTANVVITATTLDWDDIINATSYTIDIGTTTGGHDIVDDGACTLSQYIHGSNWTGGTTYYWTVTTIYTAKASVPGTEWSFVTEFTPIALPYSCDVTDIAGWTEQVVGVTPQWGTIATDNAGGTSPEFKLDWESGANPATDRLICRPLDTTGKTSLNISFKQMMSDFAVGCTFKLQSSSDGIAWTDESWSIVSGGGNIGPETVITTITNNLGGTTYLGWTATGDLYQYNGWYLDDFYIGIYPALGEDLYISEVCDNKSGFNGSTGFIELYNPNPYPLDLTGFSIEQGANPTGNNFTGNGTSYTIPAGTIIGAKDFLTIGNGAGFVTFNAAWGGTLDATKYVTGDPTLLIATGYAYGINNGV
ncbi:MAG: lamin tail domain-containing protein, partial [Candidatus Cloacimonetes bacterium]|nr:lamin tail domain-containing protein [Candidatus Cloacimonadota bacterium]